MSRLQEALNFATEAHKGQVRRHNNELYINHPTRVSQILIKEFGETRESILISAFLHDVVEDTNVTIREIEAKFGLNVAQIVSLLTKPKKGYDPEDYYSKIRLFNHTGAGRIKIADRADNLRDMVEWQTPEKFNAYCKEAVDYILELSTTSAEYTYLAKEIFKHYPKK